MTPPPEGPTPRPPPPPPRAPKLTRRGPGRRQGWQQRPVEGEVQLGAQAAAGARGYGRVCRSTTGRGGRRR